MTGPEPSAAARGLVSVVVPCFDTERYLDECLRSLTTQTYPSLQIVAVDDGSTDGTSTMLDDWQTRDPRIVVIRQDNGGLGAARNTGIAASTGEFLTFVDSDDMLPPDAIERMVTTIERTGSDFVTGVAERFDGTSRWRASLYRRGFRENLERTHVYDRPSLLADHIICSKLFRRSFWDRHGFTFPTGTLFEDIEVATRAHCLADAVDLLTDPTYLWRSRPADDPSITQDRFRPGSVTQRFDALRRTDHFVRDHAPPNVWRRHGLKVIATDIRLHLHLCDGAPASFVEEFVAAAAEFLRDTAPVAIEEQGPLRRRLIEMILDGDTAGVLAMSRLMGPKSTRTLRSRMSGVMALSGPDRRWLVGVGFRVARERLSIGRFRRSG